MKNDIRYQVEVKVDGVFVADNDHQNMQKIAAMYEAKRLEREGQQVQVVRIQRSIVTE